MMDVCVRRADLTLHMPAAFAVYNSLQQFAMMPTVETVG
jgi:hypothetical protein